MSLQFASPMDVENVTSSGVHVFADDDADHDKLINDNASELFGTIVHGCLLGIIALFGSFANVINIVVFRRQGFKDTINVSLFSLALADLGALLPLIWMSLCYNPWFRFSDIQFESTDIQYLTAGWPHVCFARITSWITAFVTFERCLCIILPIRVRHIITVRRTVIAMCIIFIAMIIVVIPVFFVIDFKWHFFDKRNKTLLGISYPGTAQQVEDTVLSLCIFSQIIAFLLVIVFTCILIKKLNSKMKWRRQVVGGPSPDSSNALTNRDIRVVKMVTFISCVFIICFLPTVITSLLVTILPLHYYISGGLYRNIFTLAWGFMFLFAAISSSVNIFIYYAMSQKYRVVFRAMFAFLQRSKREALEFNCRDVNVPSEKRQTRL